MAKLTVRERLARTRKRKATVPKAGPKKRRAKAEIDAERKARAVAENTRPLKKAVKKSGKVRQYGYTPAKGTKKEQSRERTVFSDEAVYVHRTPEPLSPEADWAEDCPEGVNHLDWMHLMPGYPARIQREMDQTTERTGWLATFSPLQRQIIAEVYYRWPLTINEIADAIGTSPAAIRASLRFGPYPLLEETEGGFQLRSTVESIFKGR